MPDKVPNMVLMMPPQKRKVGRPRKPQAERLGCNVFLRIEPEMLAAIEQYMRDKGHHEMSPALRMAIRETLKKEGYLK